MVQLAIIEEAAPPAEVWGADLREARPIGAVLAELEAQDDLQLYALTFLLAAHESGLCPTPSCAANGDETLGLFIPCDSQEAGRRERFDALALSLRGRPGRKPAVLRMVKLMSRLS